MFWLLPWWYGYVAFWALEQKRDRVEWMDYPYTLHSVSCNMCGANNDLLLSFWDLCNVFWLQLRQEEDRSWDLGTPSRWHHDNLRTSCHVDTCLLALSQAHLLDKELTKISKKLFFTSCPEFMSGWIMSWWQVRVNLGSIFYHFTTLFDDPCFIQHPAMTTTIALINFWQMIYVQLLLSGKTLWIILSFSASLYLCWIVDVDSSSTISDDAWKRKILYLLTDDLFLSSTLCHSAGVVNPEQHLYNFRAFWAWNW